MIKRIAPECGCETEGKIVRGMCVTHYDRWVHATPKHLRGPSPRSTRAFEDFVDKSGDCWVWTGPTNRKGYGWWSKGEVRGLAHRLSLASVVDPTDASLMACHKCDNPPCVNPAHLYWGTAKDNARDMVERGGVWNAGNRSTVCPRGHAIEGDNLRIAGGLHICRECDNRRSRGWQRKSREGVPHKERVPASGEGHGMARLTWAAVRAIRAAHSEGASVAGLARQYGISETHAWRIVANAAWKEGAA